MEKDLIVSICIPTYEMGGHGPKFLEHNLNVIYNQTYKNIEVIISDHSLNNDLYDLTNLWSKKIKIKHLFNSHYRGNSSSNLNNALTHANGDIIKIIFQDDFLFDTKSIETTVNHFNDFNYWVVSTSEHTSDGVNFYYKHTPKYNEDIHLGFNTISSPSVLSFKNKNIELFNENLIWLMDVEYYKRLYDIYGLPTIIYDTTIVNRTWPGQVTHITSAERKNNELKYIKSIYK